ncbi:MAG: M48 family metallopeptidase [Acidobacteria bacterium]|jgi:predicted Zn-dependent protease|nr:M48 family metallopeptidase [Acidobacteriota bacterium]
MKKLLLIALCALLLSWRPPISVKKLSKAKKGLDLVSSATHKISEEEEYYIGRAVAANILSQYPLWKNAGFTRYLNLVGRALVLRSGRPEIFGGYHFALLDTTEANAFSAPGGIILLTRGIVDMAGDEDELAAILAHEIQHIVSKDPLKAIKSQRMKALGTFTAGEAMGSSNQVVGILQDSVMDISGTLLQKGYSRTQEKNADLGALELLAATGYDPGALLAMLQKVKAVEKKKAKAFSAHPAADKRIAYVSSGVKAEQAQSGRQARAARFRKYARR